MAPSSFHKFPELPPEIQLQIWESSFRSPEAMPGGLHYIGLDDEACPVLLDKTVKPEFQRARSGYELEKGLWTACWNSRAAAMKHQQQQNVKFNYCYPPSTTALDLALWRLGSFKPSLVFILRLVFEVAHIRHLTTPTIRLIDRNARWINDDTTQLGLDTFYDCDYEYVEISMKPGSSSARVVCHSPALKFFDHLDRLLEDKLQNNKGILKEDRDAVSVPRLHSNFSSRSFTSTYQDRQASNNGSLNFPSFSQLPCELRLQIWESGIRKCTTYIEDDVSSLIWDSFEPPYGINYIAVGTNLTPPTGLPTSDTPACGWPARSPVRSCENTGSTTPPPKDIPKIWSSWPLAPLKLSKERVDIYIYEYAVEFDPAWTSELAGLDKYRPTDRLSPTLAFAIQVFCEIAAHESLLPPVIHLIDRYSGWKSVGNAEKPSVYYDCEHEYIQIDLSNPLATNHLVRSAPMLRFLDEVDRLLKNELTWKRKTSPWAWSDYGLAPDGLSVRKLIRVMARRDKEVVLKATKGNAVLHKMKQPALVTSANEKPISERLAIL
ncbi:hypothetical protein FMUND_2623 [Fusarium mundagurra]|uniref:2EXR domain-containing protein n=1 Tax=Fusarium mundagurra TaxID=1567541 RepID=A0A8H6DN28_9HYPO|nr:hypothetical protein FMUND_2623 [Fusarium mundagurra]